MNQPGRVLDFQILERKSPTFDGAAFGAVGAYECLTGQAFMDLDPGHPLNAEIANLKFAPRGPDGRVRYRVDTCIIKPADLDAGNGWLFYEVVNRGTKRALQRINGARANNLPGTREDIGTGFLLREGYSLAWSGWQGDLLVTPGRMGCDLPVAGDSGRPITGTAREEFILEEMGAVREDMNEPIVERSESVFIAPLHYPAADLGAPAALTVRARERDARAVPPGLTWRYVDDRHIEVSRAPGYDRGAIYEFIYTARDPIVLGCGLAGIRDLNSFLRYDTADVAGKPNPLLRRNGTTLPRAMAFGLSQSGRLLREFLYRGFNADGAGRKVFDGVMPFVPGSRLGTIAITPFAQCTRYPRRHEDHLYPGDQFPFAYGTMHDPVSGRTDGILARATATGTAPKVLQADTDSEIWSARASLLATDTTGADLAQPDNVRLYLLNGVPHGPFPLSPVVASQRPNRLSYHFLARALVKAMRQWIEHGVEPPPSRFPSRAAGTLVSVAAARAAFPDVDGLGFPEGLNELRLVDHAQQPPREGAAYPVFTVLSDADGNSTGGVRHPLVQAPIGTYLGWQLRRAGYAGGELYNVFGGFVPFAATPRERAGDPRLSLAERYGGKAAWELALALAAKGLVSQRLMLPEDAERLRLAAAKSWDIVDAI